MAPEVLKSANPNASTMSKSYNEKCDAWSVGAVLYLLCCGKPPFYDDDDVKLAQMILSEKIDFNDGVWNAFSSELKELIMALL